MDPAISLFPSSKFYDGELLDAPSVTERDQDSNFQEIPIGRIKQEFGPLQFINVANSHEEFKDSSKINFKEMK